MSELDASLGLTTQQDHKFRTLAGLGLNASCEMIGKIVGTPSWRCDPARPVGWRSGRAPLSCRLGPSVWTHIPTAASAGGAVWLDVATIWVSAIHQDNAPSHVAVAIAAFHASFGCSSALAVANCASTVNWSDR